MQGVPHGQLVLETHSYFSHAQTRLEFLQRIQGARLGVRLRWSVAQHVWKRSAALKFAEDALNANVVKKFERLLGKCCRDEKHRMETLAKIDCGKLRNTGACCTSSKSPLLLDHIPTVPFLFKISF